MGIQTLEDQAQTRKENEALRCLQEWNDEGAGSGGAWMGEPPPHPLRGDIGAGPWQVTGATGEPDVTYRECFN